MPTVFLWAANHDADRHAYKKNPNVVTDLLYRFTCPAAMQVNTALAGVYKLEPSGKVGARPTVSRYLVGLLGFVLLGQRTRPACPWRVVHAEGFGSKDRERRSPLWPFPPGTNGWTSARRLQTRSAIKSEARWAWCQRPRQCHHLQHHNASAAALLGAEFVVARQSPSRCAQRATLVLERTYACLAANK